MNAMAGDIDNTRVRRTDFVAAYSRLRQREERNYSNEEIRKLPTLPRSNRYYNEWKLRAASARRLLSYIEEKEKPIRILEIGCGIGWLSYKMSMVPGCRVTGIDPHRNSIRQAREVFRENEQLEFLENELLDIRETCRYDIIVFAASFQYFGDLHTTVGHCMDLLNEEGEIHILDTQFYNEAGLRSAAHRSALHFKDLNVPEMIDHYHHHSRAELETYRPDVLYSPKRLFTRLGLHQNPFPWIRIKK